MLPKKRLHGLVIVGRKDGDKLIIKTVSVVKSCLDVYTGTNGQKYMDDRVFNTVQTLEQLRDQGIKLNKHQIKILIQEGTEIKEEKD